MTDNLTLYLIRHGQSIQNTKPDMIGQEPMEPLSHIGKWQAEKLGEYLVRTETYFDEVYTSNYARARDTCLIVKDIMREGMLPFQEQTFSELREYSAGEMTGSKRSEVLTPDVLTSMENLGMLFKFPNGESLFEVQQRAVSWLYDTVLSVPADKHRHVALFSHGMTIKCLLQHFMQFDQRMTWRITLDNTSMSILEFKNNMCFLKCINSTQHIPYRDTKP